jgi:hypothetical protein
MVCNTKGMPRDVFLVGIRRLQWHQLHHCQEGDPLNQIFVENVRRQRDKNAYSLSGCKHHLGTTPQWRTPRKVVL